VPSRHPGQGRSGNRTAAERRVTTTNVAAPARPRPRAARRCAVERPMTTADTACCVPPAMRDLAGGRAQQDGEADGPRGSDGPRATWSPGAPTRMRRKDRGQHPLGRRMSPPRRIRRPSTSACSTSGDRRERGGSASARGAWSGRGLGCREGPNQVSNGSHHRATVIPRPPATLITRPPCPVAPGAQWRHRIRHKPRLT